MSIEAATSSPLLAAGLPVANAALEPAWVRDGSPATKKAYATALGFESMLVEQLSRSLAAPSGSGGESGEGESGEGGLSSGGSTPSGAPGSQLSSLLPQALSSGVMGAGGLGLAAQLAHVLQPATSASQPAASGGTSAAQVQPNGGTSTAQVQPNGGTSA
jgi:hypothetical protein